MYGEKYFHTYCINDLGLEARLSIRKKGFTGSAVEVKAGPVPFTKSLLNSEDNILGGIYPTMASIQLVGDSEFGMSDLLTANDSDFQVVHVIDGNVDWIGFLTPESFGELDTNNLRYLDLNAFDGLTRLKDLKFIDNDGQNYGVSDGNFTKSLLFSVKECLKKSGLQLDILSLVDRLPVLGADGKTPYRINSLSTGWVFSTDFNSLSSELVKVGNYFSYSYIDEVGSFSSQILDVDRSDVGAGGGTGILLSPPPLRVDVDIDIMGIFYSPTIDLNQDALQSIMHDVRVWIDNDIAPESGSKEDANKPYYQFTAGTVTSWDVLNNISLFLDCRVSQEGGLWLFESLDSHRLSDDYFKYGYDGNYIGRTERFEVSNIPCDATSIKYKPEGNTRYFDKTLKSVSVNYRYGYKTEFDGLVNLQLNGDFSLGDSGPSATYTPFGWKRDSIKKPITFNIYRDILTFPNPPTLEFSTPNTFNSFNGLSSDNIKVGKGDVFKMSWEQSIMEFQSLYVKTNHNTMVIELHASSGQTYYLVNFQEEKGWNDSRYSSGNPIGQWIKKDSDLVWHFNSSFATVHNTSSSAGIYTPFSEVNLTTQATPEEGYITVRFVGSSVTGYRTGSTGSDMYKSEYFARSYIPQEFDVDEQVISYNAWEPNNVILQTFYNSSYSFKIRIADVRLSVIVEGSKAEGRLYQYTQEGDYFDKLDDINIFLGDEDNLDLLSVIKVGSATVDKWTTRDNSLQVCPIGLLLAKSIIRRYYRPKIMLDGGVSTYPFKLNERIVFEDTPDVEYTIKTGDILSKNHLFQGTLYQNLKLDLPLGGVDFGPNSIDRRSGSTNASMSSGGASQAWVSSQGYLKNIDLTLQKALNGGNVGDKMIIEDLMVIPLQGPDLADMQQGAIWVGDSGVNPSSASNELGDLSNVNITSPTNNQVLTYNSTTNQWENKTGGSGGSQNLDSVLAQGNSSGTYGILLSGIGYGKGYRNRGGSEMYGGASGERMYLRANDGYYLASFTPASKQMLVINPDSSITYEAIPSGGGGGGSTAWGGISGTLSNQTDLQSALNNKQNTLTAGTGISIIGNVISSTGGGGGGGGVSSVGLTAPTGFTVSNSPITSSGNISLSFASGYSLPTTTKQSEWDYAYTVSHTHSNKSALDSISGADIINWNNAYLDRHTHSNKANLDTINQSMGTSNSVSFAGVTATSTIRIPTVAPSSPVNGNIWVGTGVAPQPIDGTFTGLTDTNIVSPSNGQVPVFNSTNNKWENKTVSGGGGVNGILNATSSISIDADSAGYYIEVNVTSGVNCTLLPAIALTSTFIEQSNSGKITFVAGSGVTLRKESSKTGRTKAQYNVVEIFYKTATEAIIKGDYE
jgi:hypothetical protein